MRASDRAGLGIVTIAYAAGSWTNFAIAAVGAAATLTGLLFVAASINLQRILQFPSLPTRVGQTLILFVIPLIIGIFVLIPGQSSAVLAAELLLTAVLLGGFQLAITAHSGRSEYETPLTWLLARVFPAVISCGCLAVAAGTLLARGGGGLYWLVPSVLSAIAFGLVNTWVLLIEINR